MGFLSHAQNFEDVMLWRALGHVANGVYIDIGAQHPRIDSVSRAFYERGWRGVHVEPVPAFADLLRHDRPEETVLQIALGEQPGTLSLNVFPDTGLSTAIADYAERHRSERGYATEVIQVPLLTVESALGFLAHQPVHWMKIDVEGFEEQVLRGWNSATLRPWVLVVEATIPNSAETDHEKWDHLVLAAGYRFVYFDGLNRFYVAAEHPELAAAFAAPPNIFDAVEVSGQASWGLCNVAVADAEARLQGLARQAADQARAQIADVQRRLRALEADHAAALEKVEELKNKSYYWWHTAEELRGEATTVRAELDAVYRSRSWRVSAPLRVLSLQGRPLRRFVGRAARWGLRQPARVLRVLSGGRLGAAAPAAPAAVAANPANPAAPGGARRLSPAASRVYAELKDKVEKGNK